MIDYSKTVRVPLRELGMEFIDLQTCIRDQIGEFIEIEATLLLEALVDFTHEEEIERTRIGVKRIRFISSSF
jgi:hypothetical protein